MSKVIGRPFEKGHPGGPGRPALPDDVKQGLQLTRAVLIERINKYLTLPLDELSIVAKDQSLPAVDHVVIRIIINAIQKGDTVRMEFLLDRLIGKVVQRIETIDHTPRDVVDINEKHKQLAELLGMRPKEIES